MLLSFPFRSVSRSLLLYHRDTRACTHGTVITLSRSLSLSLSQSNTDARIHKNKSLATARARRVSSSSSAGHSAKSARALRAKLRGTSRSDRQGFALPSARLERNRTFLILYPTVRDIIFISLRNHRNGKGHQKADSMR